MYVYFYIYIYTCKIHISTLSPWLVFHPLVFEASSPLELSQPIHSLRTAARWLRPTVRARGCLSLTSMGLLDSTSKHIGVNGLTWVMSRCPKNGGDIPGDIPVIAWWDITIGVIMGYYGMLWNRISHMDPYGVFVGIPTNKVNFTSNVFF